MIKLKFFLLILVFLPFIGKSQCDPVVNEQLQVVNPSFEGPVGAHITPAPWSTCGITPDTQPGSWGVNLPASEGNTYVGFVQGGPAWLEGASQALSGNMVAGVQYTFTIDLASTNANQGGIIPAPAQIVIHGANAICQKTELLWSSPFIAHLGWQTYTVTFTPTQNFSHIYFSISGASPAMSYILLDNITPIVPNNPVLEITSHVNGQQDGCAFLFSGELSLPLADSVVIYGDFVGSPMHANVNGVNWNQTLNFTGPGNQTVIAGLFYVDPATGSGTCSYDTVTVNITSPLATFTPNNVCFNNTTSFIDQSTILGIGSITSWNWNYGDGTTSTTQNGTHTYLNDGSYNVTLIVEDQNGCADTLTQQFFVYPLPVANFNSISACVNQQLTLNSQATVSSGTIDQYSWDIESNGSIDYTTASTSHVFPSEGSFSVTHIVVTNNGCSDTITQPISVYPLPSADFTFVNACDNELVTFTSQATVSSGTVDQYSWDVETNGTIDYTTANGSHVYPNDGTFNLTHIVQTNNGCSDTVTQQITVYPLPSADFTLVNACDNELVTFTSQATVSSGTVDQYSWDVETNGTIDYTTANGSHVYPNDGTFNLTHIVQTNNGCSDTVTQQITVYPLPSADFTFVNACDNELVTFTSQATVSSGTVDQYSWDVETNGTIDYTTANGSHVYPNDGTFNLTHIVQTNNGCSDTVTQQITVYPLPSADFTFVNACDNELVTFTSQATVSSGTVDQYSWDIETNGTIDYTTANGSHVYPNDGTFNLTHIVQTNNGCSDTVMQQITVYPLPSADFTFVNACDNELVTFTSQATVNSGTVDQYSWDVETNGTIDYTTANGSHVYPNDGTFNLTHIVQTNNGCSDTVTQQITVYPLPSADFTFVNACDNEQVTFTSQATVSSGTVDQYSWDVETNGTIDYTTANGSHVYPNYGTFNLTHIVITNHGCTDTLMQQVTVDPLPSADFTFVNACDNELITFASQATVGSGTITQYSWDVETNGTIDYTTANGSHLYPTDGVYDLTHIVVTNNGCSDTVTQQITVYTLPIADWTSTSVCEGNQTNFTDLSTINNATITQWEWIFGDGITSSVQHPTHTYATENIYSTQLIVTTNHGCKDTLSGDDIVWPLPQVNFSPTDVCLDVTTNFQDLSTISNAFTQNSNVQWSWSFGDQANGSSTVQNPSYTYLESGVFNAQLIVTSANGCVGTITLPVTVHPKPVVSFTGINLSGCSPVCPQLTSTSTVDSPATITNYTWTLSNGEVFSGSNPGVTFCYDNLSDSTEHYSVLLTVETNHGCSDSYFEQDYIAIYHNPVADFSFSPEELSIHHAISEFTNLSFAADAYSWTFGDGTFSNETDPSHIYPTDFGAEYLVTLVATTNQGCVDSISKVIRVKDEVIYYIPNSFTPDGDLYNQTFKPIFTHGFDKYDYELIIFNRWGERVFESHDAEFGWDGHYGGKPCQQGTYTWTIEYKVLTTSEKKRIHGHVNLLK